MIANLTGLLPLLSVASLLIVSANTIGYFTRVGPHFLGLMDLTNFIYPLGLAFFGLMLVLAVLHGVHTLAIAWHNVEEFNLQRFNRFSILIVPLAGIPVVLLDQSLETQFYSLLVKVGGIMIVSVMSGFVAFVRYQQNRRKLNARAINFLNFSILCLVASSYGVGLAQAEYQAFRTPTLYKITDKHGFDTVVRIIRASSSGLLVASVDRRIIFVPKEEYRQFERDRPISLNLSE
jgi:hypothetical protein